LSEPFETFYAAYLRQHRHPLNRALHLIAKLAMVGALAAGIARGSLALLIAAPLLGVLPCWLGHLVEGNRPTALSLPSASLLGSFGQGLMGKRNPAHGRPYYSFLADLRMCQDMLRGAFARVLRKDSA
jgi:hypothetical protein